MKNTFLLFLLISGIISAQTPQRKAFIGVQGKAVENGIRIDSVFTNSTAQKLKLKKGYIIQFYDEKRGGR